MSKRIFVSIFGLLLFASSSFAQGRFYFEGDGCLLMKNSHTKKVFNDCYRKKDGTYDDEVLKKIDAFLTVPDDLNEHFSLRTLAFVDYLQDQYIKNSKTKMEIISAYRSPTYNENLRKKGSLAGKTSYHMDAMALDVIFPGVKSEKVWEYARGLNYGGLGYYRSKAIHVDSGKPRSWTPENAIDPDSKPPLNKNLYISVDRDIYKTGETVDMFFSGISDLPFGIKSEMELRSESGAVQKVSPKIEEKEISGCVTINVKNQARKISWKIPEDFKLKGHLSFQIFFCDPMYANQPKEITSRTFEVR